MTVVFSILVCLFLAYANGANDNFKGVATLFGSKTTGYKAALIYGTAMTFLGSVVAIVMARGLLATFSGKGLVPDQILALKSFPISVVLASAVTVMLATKLGFPISTTHALTGALVGAGWMASSSGVNLSKLSSSFFTPLIVSPVLAIMAASFIYPIFRYGRVRLGLKKETCLCVGNEVLATFPQGTGRDQALALYQTEFTSQPLPTVIIGTTATCQERYSGTVYGIQAKSLLDVVHFLSAGIVSFARGLNDTPKIAALLLLGGTFSSTITIISVAVVMAAGGLLNAKKVAETMSQKVTEMNEGQGFTANLVTGMIVIFASKLGLPVSTTHVSCGALFGIGAVTKQARWKTITGILLAWVTTLPIAALFGALLFLALKVII